VASRATEKPAAVGADDSGRISPAEARPLRRSSCANHEQFARLRIRIRENRANDHASRTGRASSTPLQKSKAQSSAKPVLKNAQFLIDSARRLKFAVTNTKQKAGHVSNR